eukprot:TRINITY_DN1255_c0_g2_i4.p1 TRINITY_DN1255_c0_g2~~TRINITY_DN1255_c0_g2_i4.p1  ORF type:complete len:112 (+),score=10.12 TRINITY_DN1255_c0_g2_i4:49-336(+)
MCIRDRYMGMQNPRKHRRTSYKNDASKSKELRQASWDNQNDDLTLLTNRKQMSQSKGACGHDRWLIQLDHFPYRDVIVKRAGKSQTCFHCYALPK